MNHCNESLSSPPRKEKLERFYTDLEYYKKHSTETMGETLVDMLTNIELSEAEETAALQAIEDAVEEMERKFARLATTNNAEDEGDEENGTKVLDETSAHIVRLMTGRAAGSQRSSQEVARLLLRKCVSLLCQEGKELECDEILQTMNGLLKVPWRRNTLTSFEDVKELYEIATNCPDIAQLGKVANEEQMKVRCETAPADKPQIVVCDKLVTYHKIALLGHFFF
jgi:hypothetical protein